MAAAASSAGPVAIGGAAGAAVAAPGSESGAGVAERQRRIGKRQKLLQSEDHSQINLNVSPRTPPVAAQGGRAMGGGGESANCGSDIETNGGVGDRRKSAEMAEVHKEFEPDRLTTQLTYKSSGKKLCGGASLEVNGIEQHLTVDVTIKPSPKDGSCYPHAVSRALSELDLVQLDNRLRSSYPSHNWKLIVDSLRTWGDFGKESLENECTNRFRAYVARRLLDPQNAEVCNRYITSRLPYEYLISTDFADATALADELGLMDSLHIVDDNVDDPVHQHAVAILNSRTYFCAEVWQVMLQLDFEGALAIVTLTKRKVVQRKRDEPLYARAQFIHELRGWACHQPTVLPGAIFAIAVLQEYSDAAKSIENLEDNAVMQKLALDRLSSGGSAQRKSTRRCAGAWMQGKSEAECAEALRVAGVALKGECFTDSFNCAHFSQARINDELRVWFLARNGAGGAEDDVGDSVPAEDGAPSRSRTGSTGAGSPSRLTTPEADSIMDESSRDMWDKPDVSEEPVSKSADRPADAAMPFFASLVDEPHHEGSGTCPVKNTVFGHILENVMACTGSLLSANELPIPNTPSTNLKRHIATSSQN